jgi:hypothetical protein
MIRKTYQRRHLRAPFKEDIIYADGTFVLRARSLNISEGGLLLDELPSFPDKNEIPLLIAVPHIPYFKNFSLIKIQTFSRELFSRSIIHSKARMVRREQLSQNLDNLFRSRFGLEFTRISPNDQRIINEFVTTFSSNIIYLQTLIDSFNSDDETKDRVRCLAKILGYTDIDKISYLRSQVVADYRSLQWL